MLVLLPLLGGVLLALVSWIFPFSWRIFWIGTPVFAALVFLLYPRVYEYRCSDCRRFFWGMKVELLFETVRLAWGARGRSESKEP